MSKLLHIQTINAQVVPFLVPSVFKGPCVEEPPLGCGVEQLNKRGISDVFFRDCTGLPTSWWRSSSQKPVCVTW